MPYYLCPSCRLLSYSAAGHSTVGKCAHCDAPLAGAQHVPPPARAREGATLTALRSSRA